MLGKNKRLARLELEFETVIGDNTGAYSGPDVGQNIYETDYVLREGQAKEVHSKSGANK